MTISLQYVKVKVQNGLILYCFLNNVGILPPKRLYHACKVFHYILKAASAFAELFLFIFMFFAVDKWQALFYPEKLTSYGLLNHVGTHNNTFIV